MGVVKPVLYITVIAFCFGWVWSSLYYTSQLLPSALVGCGQACIIHHSYCLLLWLGVVKPVLYITVIAFCFGWVWSSMYCTSQLLPSALVGCGQACIIHYSYYLLLWLGVVKPVLYITVIAFCFGWVWSSMYYTSQLLPSALVGVVKPVLYITVIAFCFGGCGQACIIHHSYCLLLWLGVVKPVLYIIVITFCFGGCGQACIIHHSYYLLLWWVWSSLYYTSQLLPSALVGVVKPVLYITVITFCFGGCGQACIIHYSYCPLL